MHPFKTGSEIESILAKGSVQNDSPWGVQLVALKRGGLQQTPPPPRKANAGQRRTKKKKNYQP